MQRTKDTRWSPTRRYVVGTAAVLANIVWSHGLAAVLRHLGPEDAGPAAVGLTLVAIASAVVGSALLPRARAEGTAAIVAFVGALGIELNSPGAGAGALALVITSVIAVRGARWIGQRLPGSVDSLPRMRPRLAAAWVLLTVVAIIQIGRLTNAMTDHDLGFFLTTKNAFWYKHECIGAYLHGAELSARGDDNVYHASHYLALDPTASPNSKLEGVAVEDPFQYPPQFLLLPRLALQLTHDAATIRVVWFALQITLFAVVAALLAMWVGGPVGRAALWILPLVLISFPALHNFQFGQFHLPAVALAVAAMLMFDRHRWALGGAALATAILAKIFPIVLIPILVARRQFKALAWTAAFGVLATLLALVVLGPQPFVAFFDYHLPRIGDGSAFAFDQAWPELGELVLADNQGVFGLARKLGLDRQSAAGIARTFGLVVMAFGAFITARRRTAPRSWLAASWLALLGLASLASPGAWGDYVPVTAVWLLSLLVVPMTRSVTAAAGLGIAWMFQFFLVGTMPIGDWAPIGLMIPLSAVGAVILLVLFMGSVVASFDSPTRLAGGRPDPVAVAGDGRDHQLRPAA